MAALTAENFYNDQYPLSDDEAAVYAHTYGDVYWWGTPDNPPRPLKPSNIRASKDGKALLDAYLQLNGSMLRLGDPVKTGEDGKQKLGSVVKRVVESLLRTSDEILKPEMCFHSAVSEKAEFMVTRYLRAGIAVYSRRVDWFMTSQSRSGNFALFPLEVDHDRSYASGFNGDLSAAIKLDRVVHEGGMASIEVGRTVVLPGDLGTHFERTVSALVYDPISTANFGAAIDTDYHSFR